MAINNPWTAAGVRVRIDWQVVQEIIRNRCNQLSTVGLEVLYADQADPGSLLASARVPRLVVGCPTIVPHPREAKPGEPDGASSKVPIAVVVPTIEGAVSPMQVLAWAWSLIIDCLVRYKLQDDATPPAHTVYGASLEVGAASFDIERGTAVQPAEWVLMVSRRDDGAGGFSLRPMPT